MEVDTGSDNVITRERDASLKTRCPSPRAASQHTQDQHKLPVTENGFASDQSIDPEGSQVSLETSLSDTTEMFPKDGITTGSHSADPEGSQVSLDTSNCDTTEMFQRDDITTGSQSADPEGSQISLETSLSGTTELFPKNGITTGSQSADPEGSQISLETSLSDTTELFPKDGITTGSQSADPEGSQISLETSLSYTTEMFQRGGITTGNQSADPESSQVSLETNHSDNTELFQKQSADPESLQVSLETSRSDTTEILPRDDVTIGSCSVDAEDDRHSVSECVGDSCSVVDGVEWASSKKDISHDVGLSATDGDVVESNPDAVAVGRAGENAFDDQHDHVLMEEDNGHERDTSSENLHELGSQDGFVANSVVVDGSLDDTSNVTSVKKPTFHVHGSGPPLDFEVICLDEDGESKDNDSGRMDVDADCQNVNGMKWASQKRGGAGDKVGPSGTEKGKKATNFGKTDAVTTNNSNSDVVYVDEESRHSETQAGPDMGQNNTDDEKENKGTGRSSSDGKDVGGERNKYQKVDLPGKDSKKKESESDSADDEVEIIGESKVVQTNKPTKSANASQNIVFVPSGLTPVNQNSVAHSNIGQQLPSAQSSASAPSAVPSSAVLHNSAPGSSSQRMPSLNPSFTVAGGIQTQQQQQKLQLMFSSVAPPKPQSSLDQIELIRWEIQNRVNTRPKYFKPNPASELGPLAKFLFNIGSDLIKEAVYHDLVKIQSKKKNKNKLNDKEKEDLGKLKEIEKDLYATIGHLKTRLKKRCGMCDFRTESINVMFQHNQFPHEDSKGMRCSHCSFTTKQGIGFRYHMESKHGIAPKLHDKKATFECEFCPYENNNEQKLKMHKQRCIKQFRPYFNLHPSCISGPEINLCLDNIFYKQAVPKIIQLPQQKPSRLQGPMTNAQKQQAERKSLMVAQKTTAALAANKQLPQKGLPPTTGPRYNVPANGRMPVPVRLTPPRQPQPVPNGRMPVPVKLTPSQPQPMRFGPNAGVRASRPTIANILHNQQNSVPQPTVARNPVPPLGAFEVCEICGGFVKDRKALRIHFFYAHRIDLPFNLFERNQAPLYCATCYVRFWTAQGLRKHIDSHKEGNQSRGVVGKCILCSHHVLNLLLHMRLVHNRDLQHYLNLNMCMFCGVKTVTRQECDSHIINIHGDVDPMSGTIKPPSRAPSQLPKQQPPKPLAQPKKTGINTSKKRCMCVLCNLEFSRNVDLTRHCMRVHHTCMKCGMVVADKPSLLKHVCLVSSGGVRDCDVCGDKGYHPAYYVKHLRDRHLKKLSIRMVRLSKQTIERWTKHPYPAAEPETKHPCPAAEPETKHPYPTAEPETKHPYPAAEPETKHPCPAAEPETKHTSPTAEPEDILVEISDDDDDDHSGEQLKSSSANTAENIPTENSANESGTKNVELTNCEKETILADQAAEPVEVIDIDSAQENIPSKTSTNESGTKNEELADCEKDTIRVDQAAEPVEVIDIDSVQENIPSKTSENESGTNNEELANCEKETILADQAAESVEVIDIDSAQKNIPSKTSVNESGTKNEELADCERETNLADQAAEPVEVIDIDAAQEFSEDSRSSKTVQGHKRKLESPTPEPSPKRPKSP